MNVKKAVVIGSMLLAMATVPWVVQPAHAGPGAVPDDPSLYPNGRPTFYANSPAGMTPIMDQANGVTAPSDSGTALRKFVDSLAGLGLPGCTTGGGANPCNENNLGSYIPIATADTVKFPGSDYYEIGVGDYRQKMHSDLLAPSDALGTGVKLRGYYEILGGVAQPNHYLGPVILATKDKPVRVLFKNNLGPNSGAGKLFIPVDTTVMGAGMGPKLANGSACDPATQVCQSYTENRATLHLHGGHSPWISDGTPHQWITPDGEATVFAKGLSFKNVPDMVGPGKPINAESLDDGLATFYWTNQQSGRLMFYHDHAYGLTRLNVYAGEAAGYLIVDPQESVMMAAGTLPNICDPAVNGGLGSYIYGIPLVIQDKTFIPKNVKTTATAGQDTKWNAAAWGGEGNLWFPHVYEPNQDLAEANGLNPAGRWDYGPYVWPPSPVTNPTLPQLSTVPEAFMDTPIVNGTAYPYLPVERKAYRFRILSAANDRSFNLQLYYGASDAVGTACAAGAYGTCTEVKMVPAADGRDGGVPDPATAGPSMMLIGTEGGFLPAPVVLPNTPISFDGVGNVATKTLLLMPAERADVIIDFTAAPIGSTIILYNDSPAALPGGDPRYDYYTGDISQTTSGGAPVTVAGYGPNTRTIMQFRVSTNPALPASTAPNLANLSVPAAAGSLASAYAASQPAHIVPAGQFAKLIDTSMTVNGQTLPLRGKSINEGFDSTYGRINAVLGTEDPSGVSVPLAYIDPATEIVRNDEIQLWKVTHNGIDSHPIHFHLTDVQVVNRINWTGEILPPDPSEMGWKDTVRMNRLQDVIVAMRPTMPNLPFSIPDSVRPKDVTSPVSASNPMTNFGNEYVWHCHILGHEEFDLMRPLVLNVDQLLYAANGSGADAGIWQWDMGTWSKITPNVPEAIAAAGSLVYGSFTGSGIWKWDGATWSQVTPNNSQLMAATGSLLYGSFTGGGIWKWDGTTWSQVTPNNPQSMAAIGSLLYGSFTGQGIWKWNGTAWSQVTPNTPQFMTSAGSLVYGAFAGQGIWKWNGTSWSQITANTPQFMTATGSLVYGAFPGGGIQKWDGTSWSQISPSIPQSMVASGSLLFGDFGGSGIWKWDGTTWTQLTPTDPAAMVAGL